VWTEVIVKLGNKAKTGRMRALGGRLGHVQLLSWHCSRREMCVGNAVRSNCILNLLPVMCGDLSL
jgi:hypothetical protein